MISKDRNIQQLIISLDDLHKENFLIPYSTRYDKVLERCINLIKANHYTVMKQPKATRAVKSTKNLVDLYYYLLRFNYNNIIPYRDDSKDFTIAKYFVKTIQKSTGFDRAAALICCVNIIEGVFIYREILNIEPHILKSFTIFGQGKLSWITDRIISLLNKELYDDSKLMRAAELIADEHAQKNNIEFGLPNLQALAEEIDKNNGKEKRN